jgi:excisionase family DNA binding protein
VTHIPQETEGINVTEKPRLESVEDLAERTGLSRSFWRQRVFARDIPFYKIGRSVRFDPAEVDHWIAARKVEPSPARR